MAYQNSAYIRRQKRVKRDKFVESIKSSLLGGLLAIVAWVLFVMFTA